MDNFYDDDSPNNMNGNNEQDQKPFTGAYKRSIFDPNSISIGGSNDQFSKPQQYKTYSHENQKPSLQQTNQQSNVDSSFINSQPQFYAEQNINQQDNTAYVSNQPEQLFNNDNKKRSLTPEELAYLEKIGNLNYVIKKTTKRFKRADLSNNARYLTKVRRLYTARIGRKYYFFPIKRVTYLRSLLGDEKKGAAALFGAAARKTRNLITTLIIIFALIAIIGTGSFVTLVVINNENQNINIDNGLTFTDEGSITVGIKDYRVGDVKEFPIEVTNDTNTNIEIRFRMNIKTEGEYWEKLVAKGVEASDFSLEYVYSSQSWELKEDGWLYSKSNFRSTDKQILIISGFILHFNEEKNANILGNESIRVEFVVDYGAA